MEGEVLSRSPISLHTSLWCCTNQSWPAVYRIRRLNASRGGPCKYVCWESSVEHSVIACFLNDRKWNAAGAVVTRGTCWWWVWETVLTHLMPRFSHQKIILFTWWAGRVNRWAQFDQRELFLRLHVGRASTFGGYFQTLKLNCSWLNCNLNSYLNNLLFILLFWCYLCYIWWKMYIGS